jgi:hypothetical protein
VGNENSMLELSEPINVWVFFKGVHVRPHVFFWRERKIEIETVNLVHTSKDGSNIFYHFSVSAKGNFYKLRFDLKGLKWFLEAVEEGR